MPEKNVLGTIYDFLDLPDREIEFFCQWLKADAVNPPTFHELAVPFGVYVFIDQTFSF